MDKFALSKTDTLVLKGFAIIGMLFWHLFFAPNPVGVFFSQPLRFISIIGDFCVSAFLFCSGYGLAASYSSTKDRKIGVFIGRRLWKFYFNFWFIFIVFVPIGIFVMDNPLDTTPNAITAWLEQIMALSWHQSYNSAWWFNSLIIRYYIVFPLLFYLIKKNVFVTLISLILGTYGFFKSESYIVIYAIGIIWFMYNRKISRFMSSSSKPLIILILNVILVVSLLCLYLMGEKSIFLRGLPVYGIITIYLAISIKFMNHNKKYQILALLGKHSANIYMIHSFLYFYWFPDFFYSLNPLIMFCLLIGSSYLISLLIEKTKEITGWNNLATTVPAFVYK